MKQLFRHHTILLLVVASVCLPGCTMMNASMLPFRTKEPEFLTPRQLVPVWSDTVLHQPGEPATRGFGGRIMFYGNDKHKAVRVDGTLVVYVWDDSRGTMERTPDRKYIFPSDKLQSHYSESRLGHSYSFWLPWDAAGGPLTHLTLISRFVSNEGTELTSTPAHVVLQGASRNEGDSFSARSDEISRSSGIQRVGYQSQSSSHSQDSRRRKPPGTGVKASSIDLPDGFYERNIRGRSFSDMSDTKAGIGYNSESSSVGRSLRNKSDSNAVPTSAKHSSSTRSSSTEPDESDRAEDSDSLSDRSRPFESRVRASRAVRSSSDPLRKAPHRATWLNRLPETPRSSLHESP